MTAPNEHMVKARLITLDRVLEALLTEGVSAEALADHVCDVLEAHIRATMPAGGGHRRNGPPVDT